MATVIAGRTNTLKRRGVTNTTHGEDSRTAGSTERKGEKWVPEGKRSELREAEDSEREHLKIPSR